MKKIITLILSTIMCTALIISSAISVGAASNITLSGTSGDSKVTITTESTPFKVTVPSVLPIWVDSDNNVTVATNAKINNLSDGPIEVTNISVESQNGWTIVPFSTDFTKVPVDTKQYGMTMYDDDVVDGVPATLFDVIDGDSELAVVYDGNVAIQSDAIDHLDIGHVVFTVAWNNGERLGVNDITYGVENAQVASYLSNPAYDSSDMSYTYILDGWDHTKLDTPNYGVLTVPDDAATITVTSTSDGKNFTDSLTGSEYQVTNLIPGTKYTYEIKDSEGTVVKSGKIVPTGTLRMLKLRTGEINGVSNVRDLGGWRANNGTLKYGLVYRGSEIDGGAYKHTTLTDFDINELKDFLGIKAEVDLRSDSETDGTGVSAFGADVDYYHVSAPAYKTFLTSAVSSSEIQALINDIINDKPVYVHCAAGADRTGTLISILEAICGVSESDIDKDYELSLYSLLNGTNYPTNYVNEDGILWTRTYNPWMQLKENIKNNYRGTSFQNKAINFLVNDLGISYADINAVRSKLINGSPEYITESMIDGEWTEVSPLTFIENSRINSSGTVVAAPGYAVSDYIAVPDSLTSFKIVSDERQDFSNVYKCISYDESQNLLVLGSPGSGSYSDDALSYTTPVSRYGTGVKYMRFTVKYSDVGNIKIYMR